MRVGLISKPEHCRPHVKAIKALGVKVEVLGGNPGLTIPSRMDAVVVRTCSISHSAFNVAKAWEREGGTVFYVEGAAKAAEAVEEWMAGEVREALNKLMDKHGWMHWYLPCRWEESERTMLGFNDPALFKVFDGVSDGTIRGAIASLAKRRGWEKVHQGDANAGFPGRPIQVWVAKEISQDAERALNTFLVQVGQMRAASGGKLPKIRDPSEPEVSEPEVSELPTSDVVVEDIKTEVDSNTRDILGVLNEVSEIQNKLKEAVSSSEFERRSQALSAVEKDLKYLKGNIGNALVEMMEHIDKVQGRCAVLESKAATSSGLANRIKALEDFRKTQGPVGSEWESAIEERIGALEEGSGPAKSQSTNPFEVIEDFKRKLSASGFRGTLTLTIGEEG
jgi:hypothetical protein